MRYVTIFGITMTFLLLATGCTKERPEQRFRIVISQHAARQTYLLDTETGDTWIVAGDKDGTPTEWQRMKRY